MSTPRSPTIRPPERDEFVQLVTDLMQLMGPVTSKRMFGGHGIFLEGLMFALVLKQTLYLKVDEQTLADFVDRGLEPFSYQRQGKPASLGYREAPEEVFDDSDAMISWANKAYACALRFAARKRKN